MAAMRPRDYALFTLQNSGFEMFTEYDVHIVTMDTPSMPALFFIILFAAVVGYLKETSGTWGPIVLGGLALGMVVITLRLGIPIIRRWLLDIFDPNGIDARKEMDKLRREKKAKLLLEREKEWEAEEKRQAEMTRYRDPNMTGIQFEEWCATRLNALGWQAWTTRASGDQGADVIARKAGKTVVIQCKLYRKPVGNKAVQEAFAAKAHYRAYAAAVVSSNTFTTSAHELAQTTGISLFRADQIEHLDRVLH